MELNINSKLRLNNDLRMPYFGLGTWAMFSADETHQAISDALQAGYRHIDTAKMYRNEKFVGQAVKESGYPEEEIFITTKLWNNDHGYGSTLKAFERSYADMGLKTIDLYLIHSPVHGELRKETWQAMEEIVQSEKCTAIGVSNFEINHLEEILSYAKIPPSVNQIQLSPYHYQSQLDLIDFCHTNEIVVEAYSPLTKGNKLKDKNLIEISQTYNKTTAQILIRWCLQHQFVTIPKSSNPQRIKENADVFDFIISSTDMTTLDHIEVK